MHNNAFGEASKTIKEIYLNGYVNHKPPEYDVWKALSSLVNVEKIYVDLNVEIIPSQAFVPINGMQFK